MLGVFCFFVISGYIITLLLKKERETTGTISIGAFYFRRAFRILPPLFFFLGGLAVLTKFKLSESSPREILLSLTFLRNYRPSIFATMRHLWSLSVEEQFYLLWPFLYLRLSNKNAVRFLLVVIVATPILRLILFKFGASSLTLEWHSESVADGLAMGCLLAICEDRLRANPVYRKFVTSPFALILPVVTAAGAWQGFPLLYQAVGKTIIFLSVALSIDVVIQRHDSWVGKLLNKPPLAQLGKLSYSLYLWQQLFLLETKGSQPYAWFPLNLAFTLGMAAISYHLIEQPAIKIGRQLLSRRGTPERRREDIGKLPETVFLPD